VAIWCQQSCFALIVSGWCLHITCYKIEFVSRWRLLNYDPNSLKVTKLASEAETRRREAWAGARIRVLLYNPLVSRRNRSQYSCKHSTKTVKVVAGRCPWFFPSLWRVFHVKILMSLWLVWSSSFCSSCRSLTEALNLTPRITHRGKHTNTGPLVLECLMASIYRLS
jgi:hypothetical protein